MLKHFLGVLFCFLTICKLLRHFHVYGPSNRPEGIAERIRESHPQCPQCLQCLTFVLCEGACISVCSRHRSSCRDLEGNSAQLSSESPAACAQALIGSLSSPGGGGGLRRRRPHEAGLHSHFENRLQHTLLPGPI